jgi:hypothetical protein
MSDNVNLRTLIWLVAPLAVAGCSGTTGPDSLANPDPAVKVPLIRQAVARHDESAIPQLVHDLDSEDAAVRFYAIDGLKKLTGQTFDYVYYADADQRQPSVRRWRAWLAGRGK